MVRIFFLILLCCGAASAAFGATPEPLPAAAELFRQVESRFESITTLSYQVKRTVTTPRERSEDDWQFRYCKPDATRIDYHRPQERLLIYDGQVIVEYLPVARKALKTDCASLSPAERDTAIQNTFARVAVPGLHLGNYEEMSRRAVSVKAVRWAGVDAYLIEGAQPRYAVYIDKTRHTLLRSEIYDQDNRLVTRSDAAEWVEIAKGFWFPREIKTTYRSDSGFINMVVRLSDIRIDEPLLAELFHFDTPTGVTLITR